MSRGSGVATVDVDGAAAQLGMAPEGVRALVSGGFLPSVGGAADRFLLGDVKALQARLTDDAPRELFPEDLEAVDPKALLDALDGRAGEMAVRAFDLFQTVFPEAAAWGWTERSRFIDQARSRFEAILAVTAHGAEVDLEGEMSSVGAAAARTGASLPQLLVVLRISRDLVVQTSVEVAEERGRHWGLALSLLLTRVLPAIDRLTDAIAQGYWQAVVAREEEIDNQKSEFLGLITQDLRQPLTAILGLGATLETYAEELGAERVEKIGGSIRRQSERIARLADDLHDVSRLEGGSLQLNVRPVAAIDVVEGALAGVAGANPHLIEVSVAPEVQVLVDPRRLEQVVANLVENALAHGVPPVVVSASQSTGRVRLVVADAGPGVPDELVPTLFSRNRTLGRADRNRAAGTGLGLSLVRGLVEAMGGRVRYERVGVGTQFTLDLLAPPTPEAPG